jgi:hypothetical protein
MKTTPSKNEGNTVSYQRGKPIGGNKMPQNRRQATRLKLQAIAAT